MTFMTKSCFRPFPRRKQATALLERKIQSFAPKIITSNKRYLILTFTVSVTHGLFFISQLLLDKSWKKKTLDWG